MKVKIVIDTFKEGEIGTHRSEVWSGELEIVDKQEYLVMISVMGEGQPQPICQIPFAIGIGHYLWIPPDREVNVMMGEYDNGSALYLQSMQWQRDNPYFKRCRENVSSL